MMAPSAASRKSVIRAQHKGRSRKRWMQGKPTLLPELVSGILGRLPPRDLCRATVVCKAWRWEVSSSEFVKEYHTSGGSGGWRDAPTLALVSSSGEPPSVAFNTESKRWVRVPTLFFHGKKTCLMAQAQGLYVHNVTCLPTADPDPDSSEDAAYDQGFETTTYLVVSNPLTGAVKWLPPMLQHNSTGDTGGTRVLLDVFQAGSGAAYRITCIDADERSVEVYDSRSGCWTAVRAASFHSLDVSLGRPNLDRGVELSGSVYFAGSSIADPDIIVSFNLEDRKWRLVYEFGAEAAARYAITTDYNPVQLVACAGKLIVVLLKHTLKKMGGTAGVVYSLDVERNSLVHETDLPDNLASWMVSGLGRYLCLSNPSDGTMVAYDFNTKEWDEWPASPVPPNASADSHQLVDFQFGLLPVEDLSHTQKIIPSL